MSCLYEYDVIRLYLHDTKRLYTPRGADYAEAKRKAC